MKTHQILNMKLKEESAIGRPSSRWEKDRKDATWKELRRGGAVGKQKGRGLVTGGLT
jgi:hypothetical protein